MNAQTIPRDTGGHTPGPWRVFEHSWSDTSVLADGFDHAICLLDINHATEESQASDEAVMAANARLIAAAPEQHELLATFTEWARQVAARTDVPKGIRSAAAALADDGKRMIAKAAGSQP